MVNPDPKASPVPLVLLDLLDNVVNLVLRATVVILDLLDQVDLRANKDHLDLLDLLYVWIYKCVILFTRK